MCVSDTVGGMKEEEGHRKPGKICPVCPFDLASSVCVFDLVSRGLCWTADVILGKMTI